MKSVLETNVIVTLSRDEAQGIVTTFFDVLEDLDDSWNSEVARAFIYSLRSQVSRVREYSDWDETIDTE